MRYVGIDPSSKTGLVVINEYDEILTQVEITPKEKQDPQRFLDITKQVIYYLGIEDKICIEGFSYGSKGKGVSFQYGLGWILRNELYQLGFEYTEVSPSAVKKFATGKGNTKKDEMVLPIYKRWGFEHSSDNVRDAYVLAQISKAIHHQEGLTEFQKDVMKKVVG